MACSKGEGPTHHINQIKLLNAIAAAAAIGTSFIAANPGRAFSSRYKPDGYGGQTYMTGFDEK